MIEMPPEIQRYVIRKILEDVRTPGQELDRGVVDLLYHPPIIDEIRALVTPDDLPHLRRLASSEDVKVWSFAVGGLLRNVLQVEGVREWIVELWNAYPDFDHRYHVIFRLLDYPDLDPGLRDEIWDFVIANEQTFVYERSDWYGGPDNVVALVKRRLADPSFPPTKKWIYLMSLPAAADPEAAAEVLRGFAAADDFTRTVAEYVASRLSERAVGAGHE